MKKPWSALPLLIAAAAGCKSVSDPVICPAIAEPAVRVTVVDSLTNANITPGSTLVLRATGGATVDSVTAAPAPNSSVGAGFEMTGSFTLIVRKPGYQTWTKPGVTVPKGDCGPETVDVTARLVPAP